MHMCTIHLCQVFQETLGAAPAGAATIRALPKPGAAASEGAARQPHYGEAGDSLTGIGADWSHELEPSAWDDMRAIAMKQGLATAMKRADASARAMAGEAEVKAEDDASEAEAALQRPRRALKPAKPKQHMHAEGEQMTATQRRELKQALENSRTIRQMHLRPEIDEAPVFTPTAEEFADPMAYIASIRVQAQEYGACKIIPPAGWRSRAAGSCAVPDSMHFSPRLMPIHKLMQGVGFQSAAPTTVGAYRARADEFKAALCRRHGVAPDDEAALEALFWRIVQTEHEDLVVQYGADLDVDSHASGFGHGGEAGGAMAGAWDLRRLASHPDSLLRHVAGPTPSQPAGVPGVSSPWLYVGMCYGAFCWHVEDLWMYSCNYMHEGSPKTWYTVPGAAAARFERAARALLPSLFARAPDLLFQLVAMLSPSDLKASGVPVYRVTQRTGEFVITFPRAYHAGFSHGFNVAEAVNFAAPSWLPFGRNAVLCARTHGRTPPFSVDRLL